MTLVEWTQSYIHLLRDYGFALKHKPPQDFDDLRDSYRQAVLSTLEWGITIHKAEIFCTCLHIHMENRS